MGFSFVKDSLSTYKLIVDRKNDENELNAYNRSSFVIFLIICPVLLVLS